MANFYRWRARDFTQIRADQIHIGDELAWGVGSKNSTYGTVRIDEVSIARESVVVFCQLPPGAIAHSGANYSISIYWERNEPLIDLCITLDRNKPVLVRSY